MTRLENVRTSVVDKFLCSFSPEIYYCYSFVVKFFFNCQTDNTNFWSSRYFIWIASFFLCIRAIMILHRLKFYVWLLSSSKYTRLKFFVDSLMMVTFGHRMITQKTYFHFKHFKCVLNFCFVHFSWIVNCKKKGFDSLKSVLQRPWKLIPYSRTVMWCVSWLIANLFCYCTYLIKFCVVCNKLWLILAIFWMKSMKKNRLVADFILYEEMKKQEIEFHCSSLQSHFKIRSLLGSLFLHFILRIFAFCANVFFYISSLLFLRSLFKNRFLMKSSRKWRRSERLKTQLKTQKSTHISLIKWRKDGKILSHSTALGDQRSEKKSFSYFFPQKMCCCWWTWRKSHITQRKSDNSR